MFFVVSFAHVPQTVTESVPAKTLGFIRQSQLDCGWFDELSVHGLTPQRLFAVERG
jgi:hypothetical protein